MKKFICFFSALLSLLFTSCTEFNAGMDLGISTPYYQNRLIKASTPDGKKTARPGTTSRPDLENVYLEQRLAGLHFCDGRV